MLSFSATYDRRGNTTQMREIGTMDGLDLILLLALLPLHWTLFLLVVAQWFVRRNPVLLDGLLRPCGVDITAMAQSPRAREWLPALNEVLAIQLLGQPTVPEVRSGAAGPTHVHV
ncbi:MAG: hypothetical protein HC911_17895 [Chloroflexaceae bacterium]|nr:hypothetical protein [Chloroflexaceae bacterium]